MSAPGVDEIEDISIHAPREGSDPTKNILLPECYEFQSTLPARGATVNWMLLAARGGISIHAPREGSDMAEEMESDDS